MRRFPEESSDLPPGPWLKAGSWTLAIFYCVASFLIGRINSVMAGIYHDLGVPLDWPQVFVTHLRLPVTLTAGILTAIALIFKDQWLSADSIKRCNAAAAISLVCLGCSCVITALSPHWGPHELIHK
ncbi:MAG: hypothetical protein HY360_26285 [Verrucomicrobia bacterium]|nr:hypothetical protein [Verrucomicrobiota bacterium]